LALLGWIVVVGWLGWPLARFITMGVPAGAGCDSRYSIWALAWQTHALATDPSRWADANIYHPVPRALLYGPTGTGALPLFAPVFAATGNPILAANLLVILGCALTAWTLGLVTTRWTGSRAAGAIAGATFLATPWVQWEWVPRCPHYAMLFWFPLVIERAARAALGWRDVAVLTLLLALQGAVEIVYLAPAVFVPVAAIAALRLVRRSTRPGGARLAVAVVAGMLMLSPLAAGHLAVRRDNPQLALQSPWQARRPAATTTARRPPVLPWSLLGWWQTYDDKAPSPPMAVPPLAFLVIAAGAASLALRGRHASDDDRRRFWWHAMLWTAAGVALALPQRAEIWGAVVTLPNAWLQQLIPALGALRVPARLGVAGLMGLCLLAGLAAAELAVRSRVLREGRGAVAALAAAALSLALLLQARLHVGYPPGFVSSPVPPPYVLPAGLSTPYGRELRAGRGPLLEVGAAVFRSGSRRAGMESFAMARSIAHWRPLLNGYSSYFPQQYERSLLLAARLPDDLGALRALRQETGLELILVWPRQLPRPVRAAWEALARSGGNAALELVGEGDRRALLFRVSGA
jgi:hypothetical protein